jgi:UDP-N-acetylmuramyl-tripeptide synthetase
MRLEDLARGVPGAVLEGSGDVEITGIAYDSRDVKPGDLFVAVKGINSDGHSYLAGAVAAGAAAVAVDRPVDIRPGTPVLRLSSTRTGLAEVAAEFYGRPSRHLYVAGITGTDGKTTVTHMTEHVLMAAGIVAGAMSTVAFSVRGAETDNKTGQTTTEAPQVQEWLRRMADAGVRCAVIETTSHALVQDRVGACDFDVAAFTNVGHDHMDYHATWEDYLEAKARLIDLAAVGADKGIEKTAVLNRDDPSYERLSRRSISRRWSYGMTTAADLHPLDRRNRQRCRRASLQPRGGGGLRTAVLPGRVLLVQCRSAIGGRLPRWACPSRRSVLTGRLRWGARTAGARRPRARLQRFHRFRAPRPVRLRARWRSYVLSLAAG